MSQSKKNIQSIQKYSKTRLRKTMEVLIYDIVKDKIWNWTRIIVHELISAIIGGVIGFIIAKYLR